MPEWEQTIGFLTATGKICDSKRQEWIMMSDVLGVSMLVDTINSRRPTGATENNVLGPFHVDDVPRREMGASIADLNEGDPLLVSGRVLDLDGNPVAGAEIDAWQASHDGFYDNQPPNVQPEHNLLGIFTTGDYGGTGTRPSGPAHYGIPNNGPVGQLLGGLERNHMRPAHLHYIVSAPDYETVVTHIFDCSDEYLKDDAVFGVRKSLISDFDRVDDVDMAQTHDLPNPFWRNEIDFVLALAGA